MSVTVPAAVVTEIIRIRGREQRIPVPLAYLEGSSEQERREEEGREGSFSAGWGKPQMRDCAHKNVHVKQSRERNWE